MKNLEHIKINISNNILRRILSLPAVLVITIVGMVITFIKAMSYYIIYGGEYIIYSEKHNRQTILDCYNKLIEIQKTIDILNTTKSTEYTETISIEK